MVSEAEWETIALERLYEHGWETRAGHDIAPGTDGGRASWDDLVLRGPLLAAMRGSTPRCRCEYLEQALAEIVPPKSQDAIAENYRLHQILVDGYRGISYIDSDGIEQNPTIRLISHAVEENDWLAVNQVIIRSARLQRRFDIVLYLNGMPVVVVELKKAGAEHADLAAAHAQLGDLPARVPDGVPLLRPLDRSATGSPRGTARRSRRSTTTHRGTSTTTAGPVKPQSDPDDDSLGVELEHLIDGVCNQERFLQLQRNFVAFDEGADGLRQADRQAAPVLRRDQGGGQRPSQAVESNGKAGVVWHTQGSGKSMEMELYAHLVAAAAEAEEPDARRRHRPHRARRPALRDVRPLACCSPESPVQVTKRERAARRADATGSPAASTSRPCRSSGCTEAEREAGPRPPAAHRPAQHHRHRRRGAPQPLRRPRRLRPPHPRRPAARDLHRVHRHADLLRRPQHAGGVRRRTSTSTT